MFLDKYPLKAIIFTGLGCGPSPESLETDLPYNEHQYRRLHIKNGTSKPRVRRWNTEMQHVPSVDLISEVEKRKWLNYPDSNFLIKYCCKILLLGTYAYIPVLSIEINGAEVHYVNTSRPDRFPHNFNPDFGCCAAISDSYFQEMGLQKTWRNLQTHKYLAGFLLNYDSSKMIVVVSACFLMYWNLIWMLGHVHLPLDNCDWRILI